MAGHSKFKNIQHRKGAQDKKRAKIFNRRSKEITVAVKMGGSDDPDMNPRLRLAISAARSDNMPNDRIKRAIQSGTGTGDGADYEEIRYDGYGPGGIAIIVECLTDNRNRSASEVRTSFSRNGGTMGETGSLSFMFEHVGNIVFAADKASEDDMFEAAVEAGADNVDSDGETHDITTNRDDFATVLDALEAKYGEPQSSGLIWKPNDLVSVDAEKAETVMNLMEALDDLDDVQNVYANFDIADDILEKLAS